jgi:hypothetical protein
MQQTQPTTKPARLDRGSRIAFWYRPFKGRSYRVSARVRSDDGNTVTVDRISNWSADAILIIPRKDIIA